MATPSKPIDPDCPSDAEGLIRLLDSWHPRPRAADMLPMLTTEPGRLQLAADLALADLVDKLMQRYHLR
jgi:hypothetical protein